MTDKLPPNLLALFAPRPPLRYMPPADHPPESRRTAHISAIGPYLPYLHQKQANAEAIAQGEIKPEDDEFEAPPTKSHLERQNDKIHDKKEYQKWLINEGVKELYKPKEDPNIRGNEFHTLFVGRLPYDAETKDLEREFGRYGPIERIRVVTATDGDGGVPVDLSKKISKKKQKGHSKGYAFVVFERERDMKGLFPIHQLLFTYFLLTYCVYRQPPTKTPPT